MRPIVLMRTKFPFCVHRLLFDAGDDIDKLMLLCEAELLRAIRKGNLYLNNFKIVPKVGGSRGRKTVFVTSSHQLKVRKSYVVRFCAGKVVGDLKTQKRTPFWTELFPMMRCFTTAVQNSRRKA